MVAGHQEGESKKAAERAGPELSGYSFHLTLLVNTSDEASPDLREGKEVTPVEIKSSRQVWGGRELKAVVFAVSPPQFLRLRSPPQIGNCICFLMPPKHITTNLVGLTQLTHLL